MVAQKATWYWYHKSKDRNADIVGSSKH